MDQYNPEEKRDLRDNCEYAILQIGKNWIQEKENQKHPLWGFFGTSIGISQLGELGLAIKKIQSKENFPEILNRLRSPTDFNGAYNELIIGYWLNRSKISFEYLKRKKKSKSSDIIIKSSDRDLLLEVTSKEYPPDYLKSIENSRKIIYWRMINQGDFIVHLKIHRPLLSTHTTEEILRTCDTLKEKAKISGFEEFHRSKIFDIYIVSKENEEKVPKKYRGFTFKDQRFDEYARVRGTVQNKVKQLNRDIPGVLLIFDQFFWPSWKIGHFTSKLRYELEEKIYEHPNLSALMIITQFGDTSMDHRNLLKENESSISMRTFDPKSILSTYKVVIFNKNAIFPLSEEGKRILKMI